MIVYAVWVTPTDGRLRSWEPGYVPPKPDWKPSPDMPPRIYKNLRNAKLAAAQWNEVDFTTEIHEFWLTRHGAKQ